MPILDLQKRARELGRIRTGDKGGKGQPQKLDKFRLTSASQDLLTKAAALYGGTVRPWTPAGGTPAFELYTDATRLPIIVPPQAVSQWYETWTGGGCVHRCDGETDFITGEPCNNDTRLHQQSKPTTRMKVILRDVEGMGVWRLESHGWNAAMELPEAAEFLSQAGGYIEGHLALEHRTQKTIKDGQPQTRRYLVPVIEIAVTPAELLAGGGRIRPPELEGPMAPALGTPAPALDAPAEPLPPYDEWLNDTTTPDEVNGIWQAAKDAGHLTPGLTGLIQAAANRIKAAMAADTPDPATDPDPAPDEVQPDADGAYPAEVIPDDEDHHASPPIGDPDILYQTAVALAGDLGWNLWTLEENFTSGSGGVPMHEATPQQMHAYVEHLRNLKGQS